MKKYLVLFILITLFLVGCSTNEKEDQETTTEKKIEKTPLKVSLEDYTYNEKDKTVDMNIKTDDIEDGTIVRGKIETGTGENPDFIFTGDSELKDGKADIKVKADDEDEDYASTNIPNGTYELSLLVQVDKDEEFNHHLIEKWGYYKEFKNTYTFDGRVQDNEDGDYIVAFNFEDTLDIESLMSKDEAKEIDDKIQDKKLEAEIEEEKDEEERELKEKKKEYSELDFKQLYKNADKHDGELVKYSGKIIQIFESDGSTELRLGMGTYGQDVVYVYYDDETEFVEDDKITVYGEVKGNHTYDTTIGGQVTLPLIFADIIE